jgi:anti-anti-sigma factor
VNDLAPWLVDRGVFEADVAIEGDAFVIRLKGELDLAQCPQFDRVMIDSELSGTDLTLLELEALTFIDAAGLYALLAASRRAARNLRRLRMTPACGEVAELLRLTALDRTLPIVER